MRKLALVVALGALCATASCSFLLDYNSLQGGATDGGAGSGGGAGADAGGACANNCDDGDPCTRDECDVGGATPVCKHFSNGAVLDDLDTYVEAPTILRTTLAGNAKGFYASVFTTDGTSTDLSLVSFSPTAANITAGPRYSQLQFADLAGHLPVSAVGLVASDQLPYNVTGYFAIDQGAGAAGKVYRIAFDQTFKPTAVKPASLSADYLPDATFARFPKAWQNQAGDTFGGWIGSDNLVHVDSSAAVATITLGDPTNTNPITDIAPITSANGQPGVVWFADKPYAQIRGVPTATPLAYCDTHPKGFYLSASSAPLPIAGAWAVVSTRTDTTFSYVASEGHILSCDATKCGLEQDPCKSPADPLTYNPVIATSTRQSEPGVIYEIEAAPVIDPKTSEIVITLTVIRVDVDKILAGNPANSIYALTPPNGLEIVRAGSDPSTAPNWPVIAVSGADKIGIAWLQPDPQSGKQRSHFRRYRTCFATQDDIAAALGDGGP